MLFLFCQVVVNQDKASKQIATLRAEIQELMMELNEYKQVSMTKTIIAHRLRIHKNLGKHLSR